MNTMHRCSRGHGTSSTQTTTPTTYRLSVCVHSEFFKLKFFTKQILFMIHMVTRQTLETVTHQHGRQSEVARRLSKSINQKACWTGRCLGATNQGKRPDSLGTAQTD